VAIIGVGQGATVIAAMEQGKVDVLSQTDPAMTMLEKEARSGSSPKRARPKAPKTVRGRCRGSLYAPVEFIKKNPDRPGHDQRHRAHPAVDAGGVAPADPRTVPEEYLLGNKRCTVCVQQRQDGLFEGRIFQRRRSEDHAQALASFNPAVKPDAIDLAQTYTNEFVKKATRIRKKK